MERQPRSIGFVAAGFALLGLILAILIASCVGGGGETASTTAASTTVVAETTAPATTAEATTTAQATTAAATETTAPAETAEAPADIVDTATAAGDFTTLTSLLDAAGLTETLNGSGPFTVFAPTDAAFEAVPANVLDALGKNPNALRRVLGYHVVADSLSAADLTTRSLGTVEGETIDVVGGDPITVDGAVVTLPEVTASNGVVYAIDEVLLPPDLDLVAIQDNADYAVYFATGSAELNARANGVVADAAKAIQNLPAGSKVTLIGVADTRGDAAFNEQLSRDRAAAVQSALEARGAKASYTIDAKGAEANQNLAKARRVNIVLPR